MIVESPPQSLSTQIISAIENVIGPGPAALHEPSFTGNEWIYLKECLDSTYVSSVGNFVDKFERELAAFTGSKYAVSMINGTSALHIALLVAGVKANDEVLVPALTFVASANAVSYCNAIPHFIDCDEATLGVDVKKLHSYLNDQTEQIRGQCVNRKSGRIIRVLMPMHTFGHPVDLDGCLELAHDFNLQLVEDAAESLGSLYNSKHTGTFGVMGIISFNGNKTITSGGGGAILTDDKNIAGIAKHMSTTAKVPHQWEYRHDAIGYNYRLPNINAALGCAQLEKLPVLLSEKRKLAKLYKKAFCQVQGATYFCEPKNCQSNYWLQAILLDNDLAHERDNILKETNEKGYMTRPAWILLNELDPYKECPSMPLDSAFSLSKRLINFPSSSYLSGFNSA